MIPVLLVVNATTISRNIFYIFQYFLDNFEHNIPYNKLFKELCKLFDFYFKANKGDFIAVDKNGAKWTRQVKYYRCVYKCEPEKKVNKFMRSCFFKLAKQLLQQVIRIPMGLAPDTFSVTLLCYVMKTCG